MVTPVQKHFRKEMQEWNRTGYDFGADSIYHSGKKQRNKRPWWTYSVAGILLFLLMFSTIPNKLYNDYIVNKHDRMFNYLQAHKDYTEKSDYILNGYLTQLSQNSPWGLVSLQKDKAALNMLLIESEKLKAPSAFNTHQQAFLETMEKKLFIITYLEILAKTNSGYNGELDQHINDLNVSRQLEQDRLISIFKAEDIGYTLQPDGTLMYHIKTYYPENSKYKQ
ncbi:hypothetical protein [Mesobacillus sp. S13]|uniref:hypothetical protein n=1 Tax=Mesobacillus sp. S13 TaxID=2880221 RepID=UPI001CF1D967|nr:hypothetical protein [Mesobacillus sp. S13]